MLKRSGPNTEPCGIPHKTLCGFDFTLSICMYWLLSER